MLGLVDYGSDDEEETTTPLKERSSKNVDGAPPQPDPSPRTIAGTATEGPILGPAAPGPMPESLISADEVSSVPGSPYSQARQLIHSLTLPPLPNVLVPASPPGSPRPSTSAKVERFLDLKTEGVHFNAKLASSSALKNPSLLQNLMNFAGIDEDDQYASALPTGLGPIPEGGFPKWAYAEELAKSQQEGLKKKETEKLGERREFVAASASSGGSGTIESTGRGANRGSATERVMAGLDRERTRSPQVPIGSGRKDTDQRRSRFDNENGRRRSRSRSPKRRRDR